jgi:hypothetical protein
MSQASNSSTTRDAAVQGRPMAPPDALRPLPRPEPGFYFSARQTAFDHVRGLDANVLNVARTALAECYARVAKLRAELLNPLLGMKSPAAPQTVAVLDELLSGLIDADGNSTGLALGQCDEALEWTDVPDEQEQPLFSYAFSCAPQAFLREGGI